MKDLINRRINTIQSLEDRKIFRDIVSQVFVEMIDYQDRQLETLRSNIHDELTLDHTRPVICGTIIKQYEYDVTDNFMFPMCKEDINEQMISAEDMCKSFQENKPFMVGRTFLKCDFTTLERLYASGRRFAGKIYTDKGVVNIKVRLAEYRTYKDTVAHLYSVFIKNGMEWTTPNLPYIHKFVAFMLDNPVNIAEDAFIERIEVNLEEYEALRVDNVFPVWNLEYTMVQSINFPIATYDNVLKEHRFDVFDLPSYCYLPDFIDEYNGYVKRQKEQVSIIIPESEISEWPMYKLHPEVVGKHYTYENVIYSNGPAENFSNGYANTKQRAVRTKGEMIRILSSFKNSEMFKIHDCEIIEDAGRYGNTTYPVNDGIFDEIRTSHSLERTLIVHFSNRYEENYLTADVLSFLISELQQYIPDMKCVGVVRREEKE